MLSTVQIATAAFIISALLYVVAKGRKGNLPPGPPGLPILGNMLELPSKKLFIKFHQWTKTYGDLYTVNVAGKKIVVLGSATSAGDLLDRKSGVTSARPTFIMAGEIMTHYLLYFIMPHNDQWRRLRRITHEGFNVRACEAYYPFQEQEAANLVRSLMTDSSDVSNKLKHATAAATWRSLYSGPSLSAEDEEKVRRIDQVGAKVLEATMPMAFIVDVIPALKSLPTWAAGWKARGEDWFRETNSFFNGLLEEGKQQKKGVEHHVGFIAATAPSWKKFEVSEEEAAWTAGGLFIAGVETSSGTLEYFVQAMVLYPEVVRAAQKQLDLVVGNRPPTFEDRDKLPYIMAILKETMRWRPVATLGVPHVTEADIEYRGYVIPKGTQLMQNIWSIAHDPAYFASPDKFDPGHFLDASGNVKEPYPDYHDDIVAYGAGRRICPGRDFANNMMFIDMAYMLWAFDFAPDTDAAGKSIIPDAQAFDDHGLVVHPSPFSCRLTPRRSDLRELME